MNDDEEVFLQNRWLTGKVDDNLSCTMIIYKTAVLSAIFSFEWVLLCSLAVLDQRVGHTMDLLSPFIPVVCHSD